jgi:hypothetical protein
MKLYTVWNEFHSGIKPQQKCLINDNGDYVGILTGDVYPKSWHYHSRQFHAKIIAADEDNNTGMYHLDACWNDNNETNDKSFKHKFIGCEVTVEAAHMCGKAKVYRCLELDEYFSDTELELLEDDSAEWAKYSQQIAEV